MPEEAKLVEDPDETEVIDDTEVYLHKEARHVCAFDDVTIKLFFKTGDTLASGTRRVSASHFEVQAPGVNPLFVKRISILGLGIAFDYAPAGEFDLPAALEVGTNGILQKKVPEHFPVEIISRKVKSKEVLESELPTRPMP